MVACIADTEPVTSYEEFEPDQPRGWSPLVVALIASLVLLLGLGGALFGINVANKNKQANNHNVLPDSFPTASGVAPTATVTVTVTATAPPVVSPTATASAVTSPTGGSIALPDLSGLSFSDARTKVRDLKLGWRLVFEGTLADPTVRATDPPAATVLKPGDTVKILVKGAAPLATVPDVRGLSCSQAAARIVDAGLYPEYLSGRDGVVLSQDPMASAPKTLRWNDPLKIRCGQA